MPKDSAFNVLGTTIELGELNTGVLHTPAFIFAITDGTVGQGTWSTVATNVYGNYGFQNDTAADGDNITFTRFLAQGTYTVCTQVFKRSAGGILKIDIDADTVHTHDTYHASTANNHGGITTGISVTTSGYKTIKIKVDGKNASSSSYSLRMGLVTINRTGD